MFVSRCQSLALLLTLGILWGVGYSLARYAMTHGVAPLGYGFWQTLGPAVILFCLGRGAGARVQVDRSRVIFYVVTGLLGIAIPNSMMYFASPHLSAGWLAVVVNITPMMTYVFAMFLLIEFFSWTRMLGVILSVLGMLALIVFQHGFMSSWVGSVRWSVYALLCPVCFALTAIYASRCRPPGSSDLELAVGMLSVAFIGLLPIVIVTHSFYSLLSPVRLTTAVILLEIILSGVGYVIFFRLIQQAGPVYYSLVSGVVSIVGVIIGCLLFHERLLMSQLLAVVVIIVGVLLVSCYQSVVQENSEGQ